MYMDKSYFHIVYMIQSYLFMYTWPSYEIICEWTIFFHVEDIYLGFFNLETQWQCSLISWQWRKMGPLACHQSSAFSKQILAFNTNKFMMMLRTRVQVIHVSIILVTKCFHFKITGISVKEMFFWGPMQTRWKLCLIYK
jgi:hypothetical protein